MDIGKSLDPSTVTLTDGGFARAGAWRRDIASGSIRFDAETPLTNDAGVYAYAVAGVVHYVGSAQRGLRRRLRNYEISQTMKTASRIRQEILHQ